MCEGSRHKDTDGTARSGDFCRCRAEGCKLLEIVIEAAYRGLMRSHVITSAVDENNLLEPYTWQLSEDHTHHDFLIFSHDSIRV